MSRDDNNFGGNPGRMNSGGFNSTAAGGYNGPGDRSGTNTASYAMSRGFAPPGAGQAGRDWNANVNAAGGFTPGMNFDGSRMSGPAIHSNPIPPARPNPANVQPTSAPPPGASTPMPGPAPTTPMNWFGGVLPPNVQASYAFGLQPRPGMPGGMFPGQPGRIIGSDQKRFGPLGTGWDERLGYQPDRPPGRTDVSNRVGPLGGRIY